MVGAFLVSRHWEPRGAGVTLSRHARRWHHPTLPIHAPLSSDTNSLAHPLTSDYVLDQLVPRTVDLNGKRYHAEGEYVL